MTHSLNLPELPPHINGRPYLRWDVRLDGVGRIEVRLLKADPHPHNTAPETVFSVANSNPRSVESYAAEGWRNYQIVHGIEDPKPAPLPEYRDGVEVSLPPNPYGRGGLMPPNPYQRPIRDEPQA